MKDKFTQGAAAGSLRKPALCSTLRMQESSDQTSKTQPAALPESWRNPTPDGSELAMTDFPSVLLVGTSTLLQRYVTRPALEPHGLGVPEWRLLAFLHESGRCAAGDIANRTWMDKAQISRVVEALIDRELVQRQADPQHRQSQFLELTEQGRQLHDQTFESMRRLQSELLLTLTASERKGLFSALKKLQLVAEEATEPAPIRQRRNP